MCMQSSVLCQFGTSYCMRRRIDCLYGSARSRAHADIQYAQTHAPTEIKVYVDLHKFSMRIKIGTAKMRGDNVGGCRSVRQYSRKPSSVEKLTIILSYCNTTTKTKKKRKNLISLVGAEMRKGRAE